MVTFIRERVARLTKELLIESPYFVLPARAQATVKTLHERKVRVRVLTNSLASNDMLAAHSGYAKTRRPLLENGMELAELRFSPGYRRISIGLVACFWTVATQCLAFEACCHGIRPRSYGVHRAASTLTRARSAAINTGGGPLH